MQPLDSEEHYQKLSQKWLDGTITFEEKQEFARWYNAGQDNEFYLPEDFARDDKELQGRIYSAVEKHIFDERISTSRRTWYAAAAAILIIMSVSIYFYSDKQIVQLASKSIEPGSGNEIGVTTKGKSVVTVSEQDIAPGNDKAILILADGTRIILDDVQNGIVANQGGNNILKTADGELIYSFSDKNSGTEEPNNRGSLNTIETPKGGKFQVRLPDGSKVWLNAASSLSFPTNFKGAKREVRLTGEAYFEVAHDSSRIFEVSTRNQTVQVLGTHFNINAYSDEPSVNTTLFEGSVRISDLRTNTSQMLKPGEQAQVNEKIEVVSVKNTGEAVAWKDGYFQFADADIQVVMRQIERWYDVSVRYEGSIPTQRFGGEIERNLSLLQVLSILERTKVHFRLEGKEVVVMP